MTNALATYEPRENESLESAINVNNVLNLLEAYEEKLFERERVAISANNPRAAFAYKVARISFQNTYQQVFAELTNELSLVTK